MKCKECQTVEYLLTEGPDLQLSGSIESMVRELIAAYKQEKLDKEFAQARRHKHRGREVIDLGPGAKIYCPH